MIYTFKVHALAPLAEPLETTHCASGADVLGHAKALIQKHPHCAGVEVLMLGSRLFFMPPPPEAEACEVQASEAVTG
jgi:hypothetical protein